MRSIALALLLTVASVGAAQDVLHYKFEEGTGESIVNYASRSGIAPALAQGIVIGRQTTLAWTDGRFGRAYRGTTFAAPSSYVNTGWDGGFSGAFTFATFIRLRQPIPTSSFAQIALNDTGWFTYVRGDDGKLYVQLRGQLLTTRADVQQLSGTGWVHVALVADPTTRVARFYIDGVPEAPLAMNSSPVQFDPGVVPMLIRGSTLDGSFDVDEFRFRLGVTSAAEIARWANEDMAGDAAFGDACHPRGRTVLLESNADRTGPPATGNAGYAIELYALPGSTFQLAIGTSRTSIGATALPLDLSGVDPSLAGCLWYTSVDVGIIPGVIPATGLQTIPAPIPAAPGIVGLDLYLQAFLRSGVLQRFMTSNAFAVAIGR